MVTNTEADIFSRVLVPEDNRMEPQIARYILRVGFSDQDHARMDYLASRARGGNLSPEEREEAENFNRVAHLLALLKSKARLALGNGNGGESHE